MIEVVQQSQVVDAFRDDCTVVPHDFEPEINSKGLSLYFSVPLFFSQPGKPATRLLETGFPHRGPELGHRGGGAGANHSKSSSLRHQSPDGGSISSLHPVAATFGNPTTVHETV